MLRTHTRTDDAARVSRKVKGDLESLDRMYGFTPGTDPEAMAHDLRVGLDKGCIEKAQVFLYDRGGVLRETICYRVTAADGVDGRTHSGGFSHDRELMGGSYRIEISLADRPVWEGLKASGALKIKWAPCKATSAAPTTAVASGAYVSGDLALARSIRRSV